TPRSIAPRTILSASAAEVRSLPSGAIPKPISGTFTPVRPSVRSGSGPPAAANPSLAATSPAARPDAPPRNPRRVIFILVPLCATMFVRRDSAKGTRQFSKESRKPGKERALPGFLDSLLNCRISRCRHFATKVVHRAASDLRQALAEEADAARERFFRGAGE